MGLIRGWARTDYLKRYTLSNLLGIALVKAFISEKAPQ
jgi:hypothetical protein